MRYNRLTMTTRLMRGLRALLSHEVARGWLRFALYALGFFALLYGLRHQLVEPFTRGIAGLAGWLLRRLGVAASATGTIVGTSTFRVAIQNNCNAIYETALFASAVLAYPATWRERAWGIVLGATVLYLVNVVRVLTLIYVGSHFRPYFDASHIYIWQSLFIVFTLGLWLYWAGACGRSPRV